MTRRLLLTVSLVLLSCSVVAGMSLEECRSAAVKLEQIMENRLAPGETIILTDEEVNSYLHYDYADEMPDGVRGMRVRFLRDVGVVKGFVDFGKLAESSDSPGRLLLLMFSGEKQVESRVRYVSEGGTAQADIDSFKVDGREMKGALLDWLVNSFVAPRLDNFALGSPEPLGHNLEQVRLEPGRAVFVAQREMASK